MLTKRDLLRSAALLQWQLTATDVHPRARADTPMAPASSRPRTSPRRLHLRPAARDELRGHVRIRRRQKSGQYKAPFNQINNEPASSPTRTPPSSRRTATRPIPWSGWTCARSRSSSPCRRSTRSATTRCSSATATPTITAISAAAPPAARPATTWSSGPDWKGGTPPGIKKVFRSTHAVLARHFPHPALRPRTTCRTSRRSRPATRCSRFPRFLKQPAPPPRRRSISSPPHRQGARQDELLRVSRLRPAVRPGRRRTKAIREQLARIGIGPGKTFDFKDLSLEHKAADPARHEGRRRQGRRVPSPADGKNDQRLARRLRSLATALSTTATG